MSADLIYPATAQALQLHLSFYFESVFHKQKGLINESYLDEIQAQGKETNLSNIWEERLFILCC